MRKIIYAFAYVAALVIGICLLVFNHQAMENSMSVLRPIIITAGIIFVVPGIYFLLSSLRTHRDAYGVIVSRPWFSTGMGAISLIWGVLILSMPYGFIGNLNITFGISLIIASIAQILWIVKGRKINGAPIWLYLIPLATIAAGIVVTVLRKDFQNPGYEFSIGSIITGAGLILLSLNGFLSLPHRKKLRATYLFKENVDGIVE